MYAIAASVALVLVAATPVAAAPEGSPPATPAVHIVDFAYGPHVLRVRAGETVRFVNDDAEPHTVTATDKSFDSEALDTSGTWTHAFAKPGTYAYFCELHPYMKATIVVVPARPAAAAKRR